MALEAGFHTIVDKPATLTFAEATDLVALAREKHLFLGESTVYLMHPQLETIRRIFEENGDAPKLLTVHFTMPPFKPENFRYRKSLGGGAIMDTAPYAVSVARYFFGEEPRQVFCVVNERQEDGLDIEYSLLMQYPGGKSMVGHFGFNTEYVDRQPDLHDSGQHGKRDYRNPVQQYRHRQGPLRQQLRPVSEEGAG